MAGGRLMPGTVVTFYSYKGGVGRSFALANVATILSRWGFRVLCVDWDLDAPGLGYYFREFLAEPPAGGVVDLITEWEQGGSGHPDRYIVDVGLPGIRGRLGLLAAGGRDGDYIEIAQSIDWSELYERRDLGRFLEECRERWAAAYDFVLIDSRTGITDIGAVCTAQLPDVLIMLFTANEQSLDGTLDVAGRVEKARNALPYDRARLSIVPVPSRFDETEEYDRAATWKDRFASRLEGLYSGWLWRDMPIKKVISHTTVPYVSNWTFGERLAALTERQPTPRQISYSLETIAALMAHKLSRTELLDTGRDSYVAAAEREGLLRRSGMTYDVFLNYADADRNVAVALRGELELRGGLSVFSDQTVSAGSGWTKTLEEAITQSRHMVALVSGHSGREDFMAADRFFRQTLDDDTRRLLIPAYLPGARSETLPGFFVSIQAVQVEAADVKKAAAEIIRAIGATAS